jgi:hypothetical protein
MTFRRGGRCETFYIGTKQLKSVTNFKYLGVTFQIPGNVFTLHLNEPLNATLKALNDIKHLNKLSLTTAIKLFQLKVNLVATYALENIWVHLKKKQLERLEKLKATFLKKKALCLAKYTLSQLVYELTREVPYVEELRLEMLLPATPACVGTYTRVSSEES